MAELKLTLADVERRNVENAYNNNKENNMNVIATPILQLRYFDFEILRHWAIHN